MDRVECVLYIEQNLRYAQSESVSKVRRLPIEEKANSLLGLTNRTSA